MFASEPRQRSDRSLLTATILIGLALLGAFLICVSIYFEDHGPYEYYKELLKELGIVFMAVFSVSLLYEIALARRYSEDFLATLRVEIEKGESNAAACAHLGIDSIFPRRDEFELQYPIPSFERVLVKKSCLRIVARTLFLSMSKTETFRRILEQGATVELCMLDPSVSSSEIASSPDIEISDLESAISIFKKQIAGWIATSTPQGAITLRLHRYLLLDSYFRVKSNAQDFAAWDLSFGRDPSSKRIVILNVSRPLGRDLERRYDFIWAGAKTFFEYADGEVKCNDLDKLFVEHA